MFGGDGYFRGSSVLVSGSAGTGKTSLAAHLLDAACRRGERALCFQFEESPAQIVRNMRSIGLDLEPLGREGPAAHPRGAPDAATGWRFHLATMHREVDAGRAVGGRRRSALQLHAAARLMKSTAMLMRLIDFLKSTRHHRRCSPT